MSRAEGGALHMDETPMTGVSRTDEQGRHWFRFDAPWDAGWERLICSRPQCEPCVSARRPLSLEVGR